MQVSKIVVCQVWSAGRSNPKEQQNKSKIFSWIRCGGVQQPLWQVEENIFQSNCHVFPSTHTQKINVALCVGTHFGDMAIEILDSEEIFSCVVFIQCSGGRS